VVWSKFPDFSELVRGFLGKLAVFRNLEPKILKTGNFRGTLRGAAAKRRRAGLERIQASNSG
jgi:hypothetical protein